MMIAHARMFPVYCTSASLITHAYSTGQQPIACGAPAAFGHSVASRVSVASGADGLDAAGGAGVVALAALRHMRRKHIHRHAFCSLSPAQPSVASTAVRKRANQLISSKNIVRDS